MSEFYITTSLNKPLIAKKNLRVLIPVFNVNGVVEHHRTNDVIQLNSLYKVDDDEICLCRMKGDYLRVKNYVQSHTYAIDYRNGFCVEGIIPKGTKYIIDGNLKDVYSEKVYIKDTLYAPSKISLSHDELYDLYYPLFEEISNRGVSSGWLLKSDKTFVNPLEYDKSMAKDIIGVVGFVNYDISYIISLDDKVRVFSNEIQQEAVKKITYKSEDYAIEIYDGKEISNKIKSIGADSDLYGLKYCLEYKTNGTKQGDWYLPSLGELYEVLRSNLTEVNASLWLHSDNFSSLYEKRFMSCNTDKEYIYYTLSSQTLTYKGKDEASYVRPFMQIEKKSILFNGNELNDNLQKLKEYIIQYIDSKIDGLGTICLLHEERLIIDGNDILYLKKIDGQLKLEFPDKKINVDDLSVENLIKVVKTCDKVLSKYYI